MRFLISEFWSFGETGFYGWAFCGEFWGGCKQAGPEATRSSEVSHLASQLLIASLAIGTCNVAVQSPSISTLRSSHQPSTTKVTFVRGFQGCSQTPSRKAACSGQDFSPPCAFLCAPLQPFRHGRPCWRALNLWNRRIRSF